MAKTLKDLCFLTGVLLPPVALILYFVVKRNQRHEHAHYVLAIQFYLDFFRRHCHGFLYDGVVAHSLCY